MVSIGVDVSKAWVDIARTDNSRQCKQLDRINNTPADLEAYLTKQRIRFVRLRVTVESTGAYHFSVMRTCLALGIPLRLVNPIVTKQLLRTSIRKVKTDQKDAHRIALLGLASEGYVVNTAQLNTGRFYMRAAARLAHTARLLKTAEGHYGLAGLDSDTLAATFGKSQTELRTAARALFLEGVKQFDQSILSLLQSLPGFGPVIAARVAGELGDIQRFSHAKQIVAYAGLDPVIRKSGSSLNATGRLTKRGSPHLREALFIAAGVARRHDPELRSIYERKRAEGKGYKQTVVHVARLLTYRLYAVWQRGTPYQKKGG